LNLSPNQARVLEAVQLQGAERIVATDVAKLTLMGDNNVTAVLYYLYRLGCLRREPVDGSYGKTVWAYTFVRMPGPKPPRRKPVRRPAGPAALELTLQAGDRRFSLTVAEARALHAQLAQLFNHEVKERP